MSLCVSEKLETVVPKGRRVSYWGARCRWETFLGILLCPTNLGFLFQN